MHKNSVELRHLEAALGVKLIERNSRNVELTEVGLEFYRRALALVNQATETFDDIRKFDGELRQRLNIGFHSSMIYRGLGDVVVAFRKLYPMARVTLHEMSSMDQLAAIERGDIDIGFTHSIVPNDDRLSSCTTLFSERFLLCLPQHYAVRKEPVDLKLLRDENFIIFNRHASPYYFDTILSLCVEAGFSPRIEHHVSQWLTAVSCVSIGMGVAIVPECLRTTGIGGVSFHEIATDIESRLQCIVSSSANKEHSSAILALSRTHIRPYIDRP
jgi:DNA-binding transcriptional LysR family regulator